MATAWYPCCCLSPIHSSSGRRGSSVSGGGGGPVTQACECCQGGIAPSQVLVAVTGVIANVPGLCDHCADYNGNYLVDWTTGAASVLTYCFPPGSSCWWASDFDAICGRSRTHLVLGCGFDAVELQFSIMPTDCHGSGQWLRWAKIFNVAPGSFDCFFNGLTLPYASTVTADCKTPDPVKLYAL